MGNQDDHHDAHVTHLRALLGSILSPKRAACTRSSTTTSGTASPAFPPPSPEFPAARPHAHAHAHHPHAHAAGASSASRGTPSSPPALSRADSSVSIPEHVSMPRHDTTAPPPATRADADHHRGSRPDLIGTLQSKNTAWDALIHGSFV